MSDMVNEEEEGHVPPLSQSRYERMQEQYNNLEEEDDQWQSVRDSNNSDLVCCVHSRNQIILN